MDEQVIKAVVKNLARAAVKNAALTKQDIDFMKALDSIPGFSFLPKKADIARAEKLKNLGYVEMHYSLTSTGAKLTPAGKETVKGA